MNTFKTHFFCLCCCFLASSFSTNLLANVEDCVENEESCMCNPSSDRAALIALYNATDGANWTVPWDLNQSMANWVGVTLNGSGCVSVLHLPSRNLIGTLPIELDNLSDVVRINLHINQLSGTIPAYSNLNKLEHLSFGNNELSGSIPPSLGSLTSLLSLGLNNNELTGFIPSELGDLSNLVNLDLYFNQLSGSIPPQLGSLDNLSTLHLSFNQLSGSIPIELGELGNLRSLNLSNNQLSGNLPIELANLNLATLLELRLNNNQLSGCFPAQYDNFCSIQRFFGGNPNLPGGGDFDSFCNSGIGSCSCSRQDSLALVSLYNSTSGANWTNTWDLSQPMETWHGVTLNDDRCVVSLQLPNNQLNGSIPRWIANLSNIAEISLQNNQLSSYIPSEIGDLTSLTNLNLSYNELSSSIPSELGQLLNLTNLTLNQNELSGNIPSELGQLSNLLFLSLGNNKLRSSIPIELGQLTELGSLSLGGNQLSGFIPIELEQLSNLTFLGLGNNQLIGSIPSELGQLSNLNILDLGYNQLGGSIPIELGQLSNLTALVLNYNQLSGSIPIELSQLSNLTSLNLDDNQLSNRIPIELGQLSNLTGLTLANNELSGSIPAELAQLVNLTTLWLQNNQLNGCFPSELSMFCDINCHFTNNPDLPGSGDFDAFCNNGTGGCQTSSVWPGDTNADGCVNYDDILTLGVKHGKTGSNRSNASSNWVGQPATDWEYNPINGSDAKHADCNGDGLVDKSTDAPFLSLNYGNKHNNATPSFLNNFNGNTTVYSQWNNAGASGNANFTNTNNNIQLSIGLEQLLGNQSDFYGIGFTLDYSAVSTNINLSIANSAMGQENQDLFAFSKDLGDGQMDVAVVRTDGNNISTSGSNDPLCQLIFQLDGASNEEELHLKFQNIKIIDALGNETTPMLGASTTVAFGAANNGTSGSQVARSNTLLQMLVNATFATDCDNGAIGTATPYGGTAPFTYQWDNGSTTAQTTDLSVGMHRVTITDANQQSLVGNIEVFGNCSALPLDLLSFKATPQQAAIQLDWLTANEVGITSFDIQRSTNGIDFSTIQTLTAKGKNSATIAYQIIDNEVVSNQTYYYRIKTNEATKSHFSPIRTARLTDTFKEIIALPNPVKDELTLYLDEANQEDIQVMIYNQMGQQMDLLTYPPSTISTSLSIDWSTYPKGLYVVTVVQGEQQQVLKIIKE